ncbi:MAG TPA: TolC family protein [Candidatus Saccharimonadales bacterium]|nr:TolC family protein [Candidatus Saccharimonadales bacterium]
MRAKRSWILLLTLGVLAGTAAAQSQPAQTVAAQTAEERRPHLTFEQYLEAVLRANLELAVQRSNIAISHAGVTNAAVSPDWTLDVGFPLVDLSGQGNPTTFGFGLDAPIELGGKRGRRVKAAKADLSTVTSDYDDAIRQLRSSATGAFIDALGARAILESKQKSLSQLDRIVTVNQERLRVGEIGDIELVQSRVNRDQFKADVITATADVYSADLVMGQQLGKPERLTTELPVPDGKLEIGMRTFDVAELVATALQRRPDVASKERALKAADLRIELANANLIPDVTVSGFYSHIAAGTGGFVQPEDNTIGASLSMNLPFSRWKHKGELENAQASRTQAELQLKAAQLQAETEVRDAYSRYQAAVQRLQLYKGGMLKDADRVLEARLYAYQRGGATLLEVIDAQRTSADIYLAYAQALVDHAHALVTLEQAAAIWDVSF